MKSLMLFYRVLLAEAGSRCGVSTDRDLKTVSDRFEHEGLSFFTITLPSYADGLHRSLADGRISPQSFKGFALRGPGFPRLLSGFLENVFSRIGGELLDDPCIECIRSLRQLTMVFGKLEADCSPDRVEAAFQRYIDNEILLSQHVMPSLDEFSHAGSVLYSEIFSKVSREIQDDALIPRPGPGAVADKVTYNQRFHLKAWPQRLDRVFPYEVYGTPSWSPDSFPDDLQYLSPEQETPVKVISVPKTLKTPRIIAAEPTYMQNMQQALMAQFVGCIEGSPLTQFIGFTDQSLNGDMAREGSITGELATLDLSDASDLVSNSLVLALFRGFPLLSEGVQACRTTRANVNGEVYNLSKFASMGSALTFPIEAMVFLAIIFVGIARASGKPLTPKLVKSLRGRVRVYGDDIVVPVTYAQTVIDTLESFGLKVNRGKSFWTGGFRESCGKDYFRGVDVTPVRFRRNFPASRAHSPEVVSAVSLMNQLSDKHWDLTSSYVEAKLKRIIPIPRVSRNSSALGRHVDFNFTVDKTCPDTQRPLVRAAVVSPELPVDRLEGWGALMKFFTVTHGLPTSGVNHLERAGRARSVRIKTRWVSP